MTIALAGSGGYIAHHLIRRLNDNPDVERLIKLDCTDAGDTCYLDLRDPERFDASALEDAKYLIFTAAVSSPDQCSRDFDACFLINVTGTVSIIKKALARGCRVLFFSSDAVFGDIPGKIYSEEDNTRPDTPYGQMKKAVEDAFKNEAGFKAIRLSYVVSAKDRFTSYCMDCMRNDREAEIYHPFYRNCITITDVLNSVEWLTENWEDFLPSFLNLAGRELVSRVRISDEINRIYGGRLRYRVIKPEPGFYRNRPPVTQMKSRYLYNRHIIQERNFTEMFQKELEENGQ